MSLMFSILILLLVPRLPIRNWNPIYKKILNEAGIVPRLPIRNWNQQMYNDQYKYGYSIDRPRMWDINYTIKALELNPILNANG